MSNNSSPTYVFTPSDYDSVVPKFLDGIDVNRNLRFVTKVIPLRLNTLKHSVVTIEINISDNVDYGCVSFTRPNGLWLSSSPKKDDLFIPSDDTLLNVHVFKKDGVKKIAKYYVIVNVGFEVSQVSDMLLINIGLGRINDVDELTTLSVTYDCPVEIYSYDTGVHVYSPYDSIYNPKLKTKLYSFTEISQWTSNTLVYCQPSFNNPALPYYYGYGDKVYKVGSLIDRTFGTTYYYRVTAKNIITWGGTFTKTNTTKLTDGPRSYYDPITDTSEVCVIPKISRVGRITEIILKTTLIQPLKYRYYLGYDANVRKNSSYDTFTIYKYNGERHLPIVGSFDAIIKLGSGFVNGWNNTETDWRKIINFRGMAGIWTFKEGLNFPALALGGVLGGVFFYGIQLPAGGPQGTGLRFDLRGACGCAGPGTASKAIAGKSKFLTKIFGKTATIPGWGLIIAAAILLAMIIIAVVKFFKTATKTFREKCKIYLHRYCSTPYIEIGSKLLDREGNVSTPGLYYCDGIYYYSQTPNGTVTSKVNCTDSFYDYEEDPKEPETFSIQTSITPDNPRLVTGWDELIILPYTSGKPEPICQGTIYHSIKLEKEVPNKCCDLEIFNSTKVVIPAKQEFSCISQLDANNKAQILLDSAYEFATTNGNYTESIPEEYYGILESEFTNSPWIETQIWNGYSSLSESTTLYFDNRDKLGLTVGKTVYFDPSGCQKALKGFYTGAPYGGTLDGTPSTILSGQPIKTYQVEFGKIKSILNKSVSNTFYPTYISNWFLTDSSMTTLINNAELMDDSRTFDPLSLENNIKCFQGVIKKPSGTDDYLDIKEFLILSGGTYVTAPEGFYLPLIDWVRHTPFYYSKTIQIVLNISENCDTNIARGFYILGIDKKTNSNTPVFNSVILEVIVKSSNGKTKTYSATTSPSFYKTLIPYGTFFTSSDIISEIYISRIITQSPLNNITYTIGDTYVCPSVGVAIIPCNGSFTPKTTLGLGYYEMTTDVGQTVGPVSIDFDAKQTPDRFQIYWDNKLVCDSLFVGNVLYGPSRQYHVDNIIKTKILNRYILKNNEWQRYITPTINVSYSLSDIASNGARISQVSTPSPQIGVDKYYGTNISEGKIRLTFNKTTSLPSIIRIVTISPIGSFDWNIDKLSCYTPPSFLKFSSRADLKSDGTWKLCSNCRFGIGFNPFLHGFSLSRCGEFNLREYTNRNAKLQIYTETGGVPVKVIIFKNDVEFFSTTMTTQANSWVNSALLLNVDGNCLNQSDIYTFAIEYTQPITYEARVEIVIKNMLWEEGTGRYLGIKTTTTYLVGVFVDAPPPVTQPCQDREIGRQFWASCNLNVDRYQDGTEIPNVTDMAEWSGLTTGAWCYYKNSTITGDTYGKLYNWYAMMGIHDVESKTDISKRKKIAPIGYHVPSTQEWDYLIMWVTNRWSDEFQYNELLLASARGDAGTRLKSKGYVESGDGLWTWDGYDDRTVGISDDGYKFTALPGGYRSAPAPTDLGSYTIGYDGAIGRFGSWWTSSLSTQYINSPEYKSMWVESPGAYTRTSRRQDGRSIRLIRD